jgi:hypothetical protein
VLFSLSRGLILATIKKGKILMVNGTRIDRLQPILISSTRSYIVLAPTRRDIFNYIIVYTPLISYKETRRVAKVYEALYLLIRPN